MASTALDREAVDEAVARGSELLKQGKLEDAQKAFRAALLIDQDNPRLLALLGLTYFKGGQYAQAKPVYEALVERMPTDASHRLNLGLVYLKLGESDKAIGALEASRALDPSQGRAISYLGLAYARAGRYAEAYRSFLVAGQTDLASEIEANLTAAERDGIHAQLERGTERKAPPRPPPGPGESRAEIPLMSMPAIVIDRPPREEAEEAPAPPAQAHVQPQPQPQPQPPSMPEIVVERPELDRAADRDEDTDRAFSELQKVERPRAEAPGEPAVPSNDITAPRMTDSQMFVLPKQSAVPTPSEGQSIISRAVEVASPSAAAAAGTRVALGSTQPVPLSQLATEHLVRPEDGAEPFEVTASGALVIRVERKVLTRLDGVHVTGGELEYVQATRRSRGSQTDERFDYGGSPLHLVSGAGYLIAVAGDKRFTAVALDDDIFYLREDLVFAFEPQLRWENGNVPGLRGKLPVVQFRGDGAVVLRTAQPLVRVKLPSQGVLYVDATRLAGWIGRVVPRAVVPPSDGPMGEVCVECTGEGIVLVDPSGTMPSVSPSIAVDRALARPEKHSPPPPPPAASSQGSGPIELDVVKRADWLADDDETPAADGSSDGRDKI